MWQSIFMMAVLCMICDIDFFRKSPAVNDMGRMWGSARFMSPEEYENYNWKNGIFDLYGQ